MKQCETCREPFRPRRRTSRFCSIACLSKNRTRRISKSCDHCRKEVTRSPGMFRKQTFCSQKCSQSWRKGKTGWWATPERIEFFRECTKALWRDRREHMLASRPRGSSHANWKGGRYERLGYVFVLEPQHPRANESGYVREHILVVEAAIERQLTWDEVIHHINGVRNDNRPENLYLFPSHNEHTRYHCHWGRTIPAITRSNLADVRGGIAQA